MSQQQINKAFEQLQKNIKEDLNANIRFIEKRRKTPQSIKAGLKNTPFGVARKKSAKNSETTNGDLAVSLLKRGFRYTDGFKSESFWRSQGLLQVFKILYAGNKFTKNRYYNLLISAMKKSIENTKLKRNAPSTIKAKGRNSPARDTLQFLESVTVEPTGALPDLNDKIPKKIIIDR